MIRAILFYAASDWSLKDAAAAMCAAGVPISPSSLHARLCAAEPLLAVLLGAVLAGGVTARPRERRLRAIDATCVSGPGANNADLRIHALADLASGMAVAVSVTGAQVGESASLHPTGRESLALLDRGYSNARGLRSLSSRGSAFVARVHLGSLPLFDTRGRRVKPGQARKALVGRALDLPVWTAERPATVTGKEWAHRVPIAHRLPLRLLVVRFDGERAPLWLVTNLTPDEACAQELGGLYQQRWQIELMFKRWKSLGGLDRLRSRNGRSARAWTLAKLLLMALTQRLVRPSGPVQPDGRRHSAWSRTRAALHAIMLALTLAPALLLVCDESNLTRLCESSRSRSRQAIGCPIQLASSFRA